MLENFAVPIIFNTLGLTLWEYGHSDLNLKWFILPM